MITASVPDTLGNLGSDHRTGRKARINGTVERIEL